MNLIRDSRFDRFEQQTRAMAKQDVDGSLGLCVTATFVGRIDAVSSEIYDLRKKNHDQRGPGFGQMGLYDAQFVLQSVIDDAKLSICNPDAGPVPLLHFDSNQPPPTKRQ